MSKSRQRVSIEALLTDRARYEGWLAQLAAKAGQVPDHVAARVRADYEGRLSQVVEELRSRADELRSEADSLAARIAELEVDLARKRDARTEDELRAMVGEFTDDEWAAKRAAHDGVIGTLEAERGAREADLARVQDLLDQATRPSRAEAVLATAEIADDATATGATDSAPVAASQPATEPEPTVPASPGDLSSLFDESAEPPAHAAAKTISGPAQVARKASPFDEIEFLKRVVGRTTPLDVTRASEAASRASQVQTGRVSAEVPNPTDQTAPPKRPSVPMFTPPSIMAPSANEDAPPMRASAPAAAASEHSAPASAPVTASGAYRSAAGAEISRTLKCQECGWMNVPTEWYCEKCGGELAAF